MATNINLEELTQRAKALEEQAKAEGKTFMQLAQEKFEEAWRKDIELYANPFNLPIMQKRKTVTHTGRMSDVTPLSYAIEDVIYTTLDAETIAAFNNIESYQERFLKDLHEKFKAVCIANPGKRYALKWSDMDWPPVQKQNSFHTGLTVQIVEVP